MDELIKQLKENIKYCKDCEMPLDWVSFTTGIGVLISANEAQKIVDALEAIEKKESYCTCKDDDKKKARIEHGSWRCKKCGGLYKK